MSDCRDGCQRWKSVQILCAPNTCFVLKVPLHYWFSDYWNGGLMDEQEERRNVFDIKNASTDKDVAQNQIRVEIERKELAELLPLTDAEQRVWLVEHGFNHQRPITIYDDFDTGKRIFIQGHDE